MNKYSNKLKSLKQRRNSEIKNISLESNLRKARNTYDSALYESMMGHYYSEDYEQINKSDSLKYALGSMKAVPDKYTAKSFSEGERVIDALKTRYESIPKSMEFRYQGSLPINVHIRGASDVDILVVDGYYCKYSLTGSRSSKGFYNPISIDLADVVLENRRIAKDKLTNHFHQANVDDSRRKSINLSGGSLAREIDVVPSLYYHSDEYQSSLDKDDLGIYVVDKLTKELSFNNPFKIRKLIDLKNNQVQDGLKKAIRLVKNIKNDAEDEIDFSSFNIMSILYYMKNDELSFSRYFEGALIFNIYKWMKYLSDNKDYSMTLKVIDDSRRIIQDDKDWRSFLMLFNEYRNLIVDISKDINNMGLIVENDFVKAYI